MTVSMYQVGMPLYRQVQFLGDAAEGVLAWPVGIGLGQRDYLGNP